jgi:hypothetical protein
VELVLELAKLSSLVHYCGSALTGANFSHYSQQPMTARALAMARLEPIFK